MTPVPLRSSRPSFPPTTELFHAGTLHNIIYVWCGARGCGYEGTWTGETEADSGGGGAEWGGSVILSNCDSRAPGGPARRLSRSSRGDKRKS